MSTAHRVVVDTDTGIDDALALLYLAGRPHAEIAAVTSVFGNCAEQDAVRNIGYVTRLLGLPVPIARGAAGPLSGTGRVTRHAHGEDGLGDRGYDRPMPAVAAGTAAELLVRLANERPGDLDLLTLGPLTNLALALRTDPALFTKYRSVVLMGGSGPYTLPCGAPMLDVNIANDPEAARTVVSAPRNELVMVGVNVTASTILEEPAIAALRAACTPIARFATEILDSYLDFYEKEWGRRVIPLHDPLAAGILLDPGLATAAVLGPVGVVREGHQWRARPSRTAEGPPPPSPYDRAPGTRVITAVDSARFAGDLVQTLVAGPGAEPTRPRRPGG
ncbi:nucleoside hydrolase [Sphaerisporangium sp. NPDC088356]|uniref:nucleoside hydrolase n=1 Tax=Sphaerisporangium sp. NPDC088356 TaxID=3154871 RepID=UPI00342F3943